MASWLAHCDYIHSTILLFPFTGSGGGLVVGVIAGSMAAF